MAGLRPVELTRSLILLTLNGVHYRGLDNKSETNVPVTE
jgi:hypothetical protein